MYDRPHILSIQKQTFFFVLLVHRGSLAGELHITEMPLFSEIQVFSEFFRRGLKINIQDFFPLFLMKIKDSNYLNEILRYNF